MGNIPNFGPEIINGVANSAGVFFGFRNRSSSLLIKNVDGVNSLLYHFNASADASPFTTLAKDTSEHPIVDSVMGINVKTSSAVTAKFEVVVSYDYLR